MRTLVVGCDASGKSSLIDAISHRFGDVAFESTSTDESRNFKRHNLTSPINSELIDQREEMYMKLSRNVLRRLSSGEKEDYLGTDSTLVTRLSHNVMRRCIGDNAFDYSSIVQQWLADEAEFNLTPPSIVVMTYAPFELILSRIQARLNRGDKDEKFWGFNSPFFLKNYQEAWLETRKYISLVGIRCVSFDTSIVSVDDSLQAYTLIRSTLAQE